MLTSDGTVSDHLTRFLKHFKTCLHSHIIFVESCLGKTSDEEKCKKAKEVYDKQYEMDDICQEMEICRENLKVVERFCLRINQYIEYRFSKVKIEDKHIMNQFSALKTTLYTIFFHFSKDSTDLKLPNIVAKVSEIQNRYLIKIFERLLSLSTANQFPLSLQESLKHMIQFKLTKRMNLIRSQNSSQLKQSSFQSTRMQRHDNFAKQKPYINPILRPRRITLQTNIGKHYNSCFQGNFIDEVKTAERIRTKMHEDSVHSLSPAIQYKQQKTSFNNRYPNIEANKNLEGAMDFQFNFQPTKPKCQIMKQLRDLNKKNEMMIRKFTKKCDKKKKKISLLASSSDAKLIFPQKQSSHKRSNTIQQQPKQLLNVKKKASILPMIRKKSRI